MKRLLFLPIFLATLLGNAQMPMHFENQAQLVIHNRILTTVQGKAISVMDVMKKMDVYLVRNYPHLANNKEARHQFYTARWRETLDQLINTEFMIADAQQREIKVGDAEVRETLFERFGPNVMGTLEKIGISYDEARAMIHDEMIVQRMTWYRVHSKALQKVNPQDIKKAYQEYLVAHPPKEEWKYQVMSIRTTDERIGAEIATKACTLLSQTKVGLTQVAKELSQDKNSKVAINVSKDVQVSDKDLSASHKDILKTLTVGQYSKPISQVSRIDKAIVFRIFHLLDHTQEKIPTFRQLANHLHDELIDKEVNKENSHYIVKLRERFGFNEKLFKESFPANFEPFTLE
jgi:hypothetical protein